MILSDVCVKPIELLQQLNIRFKTFKLSCFFEIMERFNTVYVDNIKLLKHNFVIYLNLIPLLKII